jgi:anthranilate synthase component 1
MKTYQLKTTSKCILADTITPVSVYLKIRDKYPNSILLESSDYHGHENSFSYICFNAIASIKIENNTITEVYPDDRVVTTTIEKNTDVVGTLSAFSNSFKVDENPYGFINNGLFGFVGYDAVRYFEDVEIGNAEEDGIPDLFYAVYQNIVAIDHFKNEAYLFSHNYNSDDDNIAQVEALINARSFASFQFETEGEEYSNFTDVEFLERIAAAKQHCYRGDVFQLVLSRRFSQAFKGDDFNVYRALRSINPSPYLFYFDYGSFKIFGSSPEAQLVVKNDCAEIHPIAGTFRRTGDDGSDAELAKQLAEDPKENAEHVMLVDLARNDLSRHGEQVKVDTYKEVQFYSHVIHLVSKVTAKKDDSVSTMQLVADTFPAGTLSGAPKHKAMQLIEKYEKGNRQFYGGCIGFMGFNGDFNNAIVIRSFMSKDNTLHYQAGAGIVSESNDENELQEVYNKLAALKNAIQTAEKIN